MQTRCFLVIGLTALLLAFTSPLLATSDLHSVWIEAEWFDKAQAYPLDDGSQGQGIITQHNGQPATYGLSLEPGRDYRVWVRVLDSTNQRRTGAQGAVSINGVTSQPFGGSGEQYAWYPVGSVAGGEVHVQLSGLTDDPNECIYDAVYITDDANLNAGSIEKNKDSLRAAGWAGNGPRIALIHGDYSRGVCVPANAWDRSLTEMGCLVEKWSANDVAELSEKLDQYDIVLFTVMYRWGAAPSVYFNDLAPALSPWVRKGGLLMITGAREDGDIAWLHNIHPALSMTLGESSTGQPGTISDTLRSPHPLEDGLDEWPLYYNLLPWPAWPHCVWPNLKLTPTALKTGNVLISDIDNQPLLLNFPIERGAIVVGTLFHGKGLDGWIFENLWASHAANLGRSYTPRPSPPTLAQELEPYPDSVGEPSPAIHFDEQGTMLVDGEPFFPFGFYLVSRTDSLALMKEKGFNAAFGPRPDLTDEAAKHGIHVVAQMTLEPDDIVERVQRRRGQSNYLAYSIVQEPEVPLRHVRRCLDIVRKSDPDKPTFVLLDHAATFPGFAGLADYTVTDPYCVSGPTTPLNKISDHVRQLHELNGGKPVWTVLQAMRFAHYVVPTPEQLRAINYLAIVSGSRGIFWFPFDENVDYDQTSYIRYADNTFEQPVWDTLCSLAQEMQEVTPWIISDSADGLITHADPDTAVHAAAWRQGDRYLLMVVNSLSEPHRATLRVSKPVESSGTLFDRSPELMIDDQSLTIDLPGYGVGLYLLKPLDTTTP